MAAAKTNPAASVSSEPEYVWVVETMLGIPLPRLQKYGLVRRNAQSVTVRKRSRAEHTIRFAAGRHFFFEEPAFLDWCRKEGLRQLRMAERTQREMAEFVKNPLNYVDVIPYQE